jgi:hypothetical protein
VARVRAIVGALWTAVRRNRKSLASFSGNNLYYAGFTLLFMLDPGAFVFFLVLIGVVLFFPLSSDPLRVIPQERFALWPVTARERRVLRFVSLWVNPLVWVLAALLFWKRLSFGVWAMFAGLFTAGFVLPSLPFGSGLRGWRRMPQFWTPLNQLLRKNLRELLSILDVYCGLVLALPAAWFRAAGILPTEATLPLTMVIILTISTYPQSLFALDGPGGMTRYKLLPIAGWQMLIAKDLPFLSIAVLLTAALSPLPALSAAFVALAVGHHASVRSPRPQMRWRFQTAPSFGISMGQMIGMLFAAGATYYASPWSVLVSFGVYGWSVWWYGNEMQRAE